MLRKATFRAATDARMAGGAVDAARRAGYQWPEKLGPRLVEKSREKRSSGSHQCPKGTNKGTFLIVVARCLVCGKPVCLDRATYQNNCEHPLRLPQDISDVVALLVSDDARWITGQNLRVNGGII